jgi:transcriptional regulator with XRE-family HTH domain
VPRTPYRRHIDDEGAFALRLRTARKRARLSQRQLAFPGCSPAYISRIEGGERVPSLHIIRELATRLGVSAEWLATGAQASDGRATDEVRRALAAYRLAENDGTQRDAALEALIRSVERLL